MSGRELSAPKSLTVFLSYNTLLRCVLALHRAIVLVALLQSWRLN